MIIFLNGESREIPDGLTLARLLECLKLAPDRVAVERNLRIVPRAEWEQTLITAGDRLEVVHFVGGGGSADLRFSGPRFCCLR
jgi:thiamine biosynthesis protein ThiS